MVPIIEQNVIIATDTDVLNGTRLNTIPYPGKVTFMFSVDLANATNHWLLTLQLPDGDVPIDSQILTGTNPSLGGVLDERTAFRVSYRAAQGGHFTVSLTEVGTAIATWRAVLSR